ncbi:5-(carboxyamino)imidazole ribonucleotide synthase [Nannocystis sp.]|uniref:5-(carboxyamino)imidazole ribonucleotide synthase n=1 Tax=Nannocystis sp. TaxID=1962667 RepID=UPI0024260D67|nr:5-(carboxyamino)imidazole ribonucleotide synthase [Nannocystis sp.]MBK7824295.1 5-(carboxyamino)imidazole ribonucleotide synthase [Nannocystis sp.]MBK9755309.1 5-(carboxyamino)imidazole ribonucleotide synthase [Nannocystis sp.]
MSAAFKPVLPGASIGVLGSGQLGRMFAIAARRMGYRVHTYSPGYDTPTGQVADLEVAGPYEDLDAVAKFAAGVEVVTFEFENVPAATAAAAARAAPVRPSGEVLHVTQHRLREKGYLAQHGFPVTPFRAVRSLAQLEAGLAELGCPALLKTAGWGYDGKGQVRISGPSEAAAAWQQMAGGEAVLEAFVHYEREVSVVAARGHDGQVVDFGVIENHHVGGILDISLAPARVSPGCERAAREIARAVLESLGVVGVLCVEFFALPGDVLLINELAPRPHNSGHLTFDACVTSQFEQQLRAVCGLPLGATDLLRPAAMANLMGEQWRGGEPRWLAALELADVKLHLYGKSDPRPGRKMGHLTALADSGEAAAQRVLEARSRLLR